MARLRTEGISDALPQGASDSPWILHQECSHKLPAYIKQQSVGGHYVAEDVLHVNGRSVPCYDETLHDDKYQLGLGALPRDGMREHGLAYPGMTIGGVERLSRHDW